MLLYRPVGLEELHLVYQAEMRAFPPRLPEQPIFYPVTNEPYAQQIARDWNTKSGSLVGFTTRFSVADAYASRFERKVVGAREHEERWVPAEDLAEFNAHITAPIDVIGAHFGEGYRGHVPEAGIWAGKTAQEQFFALARSVDTKGYFFGLEIDKHHDAIFLNYLYWEKCDFGSDEVAGPRRDEVLSALKLQRDTSRRGVVPLGEGGRGDTTALLGLPFRLVVRDVFRGKMGRTTVTGRVAAGCVRVGAAIEMVVDGVPAPTEVCGLERHRERVVEVSAGEEVAIEFRDTDGRWIQRGDELRAVTRER